MPIAVAVVFVLRRLGVLVVTLVVASVAIFAALALAPGDPAAAFVGGTTPSPDAVAAIREQYHLDDPFWSRYWDWASNLLTGHIGDSFVYQTNIATLVGPRLQVTLLLVLLSATLIMLFGVGSGIVAALSRAGIDRAITVLNAVLMGVPTFVVVIVLILVFSRTLDWFPVYGTGEGLLDVLHHLVLPAVAIAIAYLAFVSRVTRTAVRTELTSEHVETARSRGIPYHVIIRKHVLRNGSAEVFSVAGITIAGLIAGTAVAERAFGINGVGALLVDAASRRDIPVVQIISLFMVGAFVVMNSLVDVVNTLIDPRIGQGRRK